MRMGGQRRSGRDGGMLPAGVVTLLVVVGVLGLMGVGALSQDVRAATFYGWNGWDGNSVIYMTSALTNAAQPRVIPTTPKSGTQTSSQQGPPGIANVINVSAGQDSRTTNVSMMFDEFFVGTPSTGGYLQVNIPIAAGGGGMSTR